MARWRVVIATLAACIAVLGVVAGVLFMRESHEVDVASGAGDRALSRREQRAVQETAEAAFHDARAVLPGLPGRLSLIVLFGTSVIPETGENATVVPPAEIVWTVDPDRELLEVIRTQLRASLFHELHHLARAALMPTTSLMDRVVTEGRDGIAGAMADPTSGRPAVDRDESGNLPRRSRDQGLRTIGSQPGLRFDRGDPPSRAGALSTLAGARVRKTPC